MSYITAIGTATPRNKFSQDTLSTFMEKAMQLNTHDSRRLNTIFKASGIESRYSVLEDYGREKDFSFYPNTSDFEPFPSTERRLAVFRKHAITLSAEAAHNAIKQIPDFDIKKITHIIVACCTGMYAPGLDIDLVKALQLQLSVQRTCINFMGCYAAFNALKVGDAFCRANDDAKILIVCTELCSLHFQKAATDDNLLANALFADGSAAVIMESVTTQPIKLKTANFQNELVTDGQNDMAWTVGDIGFEMKLSSYVPSIIKGGIRKLTHSLLSKLSMQLSDIRYFAIHPGGKKILQVIEQELGITKEQNASAYKILKNYGNMSSPTVLFVLADIFDKLDDTNDGEHILSFAFGPGLTLESMILKIETR
jgi:prepilin-type processing-associated H-X9-DG protein